MGRSRPRGARGRRSRSRHFPRAGAAHREAYAAFRDAPEDQCEALGEAAQTLFPTVRMYLWDHLVSVDGEEEYVFLNIAALKAIKGKFPELRYDRATRKFVRREDGE